MRRNREAAKVEADTVVIADKAVVNQTGERESIRVKRRRRRGGGRIYESTPGWGRNDVPVGKGTKGTYRKAAVQPLVKTALTEVE